jgi:glycosyltransferase involved in cell wall biosynthesis
MKLLYVVQRYGEDIVGGSEAACRQFAEALVGAGHEVDVLTSCARSYVTWENSYDPGESLINGVRVHRLPVIEPRYPERFGPMDQWLMSGRGRPSTWEHQRWASLMGPNMDGLREWLMAHYSCFDAAIFMTYLYASATRGIPVIAGRIPVVFQPTAHLEPAIAVPLFESTFRLPDAFLFFTPEEQEVVDTRFRIESEGSVVGIGIEMNPPTSSVDEFRSMHNLGDDPYVIYVGRLDPMKGVKELVSFFVAAKELNPSPVKLVLAGDPIIEIPNHPDIVVTGFLDEPMKQAAIKGSEALIQSSYFESFSIVLCEAWVQERPALVQGASPVLRGQALRSGGAIPYEGFAEFEQALQMITEARARNIAMGKSGRRYVEEMYDWANVIKNVEATLDLAQKNFNKRVISLRSSN